MVAPRANPAPAKVKLGDILRDVFPELWGAPWLNNHQRSVLYQLSRCGTNESGVVKLKCEDCGNHEWLPMSCQVRHCPSCGAGRAEDWVQARLGELLEVPYYHLTFNLPQQLHALCKDNPTEVYGLLFTAVQRTIKAFAADNKHLGGTPAFFAVLHTATRRLHYWPHIHVTIAGATFDEATGKLAIAPEGQPLFDAEALADAFRERLLEGLRACAEAGKLTSSWHGTQVIEDPQAFEHLLEQLQQQRWKVWLEPATPGVETTIRYLGRHVQRTAITNAQITHYDGTSVTYTYQDSRTQRRHTRTVHRREFVRLFAQHILPKGLQRVRFFGLLAPSKRKPVLPRAQAAARVTATLRRFTHAVLTAMQPEAPPAPRCQACGSTRLRAMAIRRGNTHIILHPPTYSIPPPSSDGRSGRKAS
jgi:hypothetical protein